MKFPSEIFGCEWNDRQSSKVSIGNIQLALTHSALGDRILDKSQRLLLLLIVGMRIVLATVRCRFRSYRVMFFNWASPEFAMCWPVIDRSQPLFYFVPQSRSQAGSTSQ